MLNNIYLSIKEASNWASNYLGKEVTISNISYLIQYGRIRKIGHNGSTQILKSDLERYYKSINKSKFKDNKLAHLIREIETLSMVDHPNIVKYKETFFR